MESEKLIRELQPDAYENVRDLFSELWYHLNLFAIIEGKYRGQVFADHVQNPTAALIWDQVEGNWYLAGDCTNLEVVKAVGALVSDVLVPAGSTKLDMVEFIVNWHPAAWEAHFDGILAGTAPLRHLRKHFMIDHAPAIDWRTTLPEGFELHLVDDGLRARNDLVNIDELRDWGSGAHDALKPLMGGGIGCCILKDKQIVSWCMGDCVAGSAVEIGIHTDEPYRRQGLGSLATAATVEICLESGADYVGWHCWSSNVASAKTALKVGFRQTVEHPVYHAWFNRVDNQFVRGDMLKFEYDDPAAAVEAYTRGLEMLEEEPLRGATSRFAVMWMDWVHYNMAGALATAGDLDAAFKHLHRAIDWGYKNGEQLRADPELASLRRAAEWHGLLARIDGS